MPYFKVNSIVVLLLIVSLVACNTANSKDFIDEIVEEKQTINYEEQARFIIGQSFATLNANLKREMTENGIENAINYCNLNANQLVDSLSQYYHADIKRTSLKLRNPENAPNAEELENLQFYKLGLEQEVEFGDQIAETEETFTYYKPIFLLDACTKCHGKEGETLNSDAYAKIKDLYPDDAATGYAPGDLRGMWVVSIKK